MIKTYDECMREFHTDYQIKKAISEKKLYRLEPGIYSTEAQVSMLAIIIAKYPTAIITMESAFYYQDLTDDIPDKYCIATEKHAYPLKDHRIKQYYYKEDILPIGVTTMKRNGIEFRIYDKERMLIELLRNKNHLPYDFYKEVLGNYRNMVNKLDIQKIQEYAESFPKHKKILEMLEVEVF